MSRLHAFASTAAEVASHFGVEPVPSIEMPVEKVEGLPGLVVFESGGKRHLRTIIWGFPRFTRAMHTHSEEPRDCTWRKTSAAR